MRRRWGSFSVLAALHVCLAGIGSLARATAQESGDKANEERSAVAGGWIVTTPDVPGAPPALYTFTAEGNLLQTGPRGVATGVWEADGDSGAAFTIIFFALDAQGRYIKETVNGTLKLDDGDDAWVAIYDIRGVDPDGGETFTSQGTAQGERITVEGADDGVQPDDQTEAPVEGTPEA